MIESIASILLVSFTELNININLAVIYVKIRHRSQLMYMILFNTKHI